MTVEGTERAAPLVGVVGVALFLSAFAVNGGDTSSKHGAELARFYADHRTGVLVGSYMIGLAMFALLVGAWGMRPALPGTSGDEWSAIFASFVCLIAVELGVPAATTTLAFISDDGPVSPNTADALDNLATIFSHFDWFPTAFFFLLVARAILGRRTLLPRWLGWFALIVVPPGLLAAYRPLGVDIPVSLLSFVCLVALFIVSFLRARHGSRDIGVGT